MTGITVHLSGFFLLAVVVYRAFAFVPTTAYNVFAAVVVGILSSLLMAQWIDFIKERCGL